MKHANGSFLLTSMKIVPALVTAALGSIAFLALADDLPKSGSISIHSGYHVNGESINVAEKIAQIRAVSFEHIAQATTRNAERLFGLGNVSTPGQRML